MVGYITFTGGYDAGTGYCRCPSWARHASLPRNAPLAGRFTGWAAAAHLPQLRVLALEPRHKALQVPQLVPEPCGAAQHAALHAPMQQQRGAVAADEGKGAPTAKPACCVLTCDAADT